MLRTTLAYSRNRGELAGSGCSQEKSSWMIQCEFNSRIVNPAVSIDPRSTEKYKIIVVRLLAAERNRSATWGVLANSLRSLVARNIMMPAATVTHGIQSLLAKSAG